jgi:hypothetical protein
MISDSIAASSSLRAKRSNPEAFKKLWIASSLTLLAMTIQSKLIALKVVAPGRVARSG